MNKKGAVRIYGLFLILAAVDCAANTSPLEVADGFWNAVKGQDVAAVSVYVTSESLAALEQQDPAWNILPVNQVTLGRIVIDGDHAWIDTVVEVADEQSFQMPVRTVLQQENQQWKVDYRATVASIRQDSAVGRVLGDLGVLSRQFTDKLNQSLEQAQKALPEIEREIGKIEQELDQTLLELRQRMEVILRQLDKALGGENGPGRNTPPAPRTREI